MRVFRRIGEELIDIILLGCDIVSYGPWGRFAIPISLCITALLVLITGIFSWFEVLYYLGHAHLKLNLGVFMLFNGIGLFLGNRRSRGWVTSWIILGGFVMFILMISLVHGQPNLNVNLFGQEVHGPLRYQVATVLLIIGAVASIFMLWAMWRKEAEHFFANSAYTRKKLQYQVEE